MGIWARYPLPCATGAVTGVLVAVLAGWLMWTDVMPESIPWALGTGAVTGLLVGAITAVLVWTYCRLLCGLVVVGIPGCWREHAELCGLLSTGQQGAGGHRERRVIPVARFRAHARIRQGALEIPVRTDFGTLNRGNAQAYAEELARVMGMASADVSIPDTARNTGVIIFRLSAKDATA